MEPASPSVALVITQVAPARPERISRPPADTAAGNRYGSGSSAAFGYLPGNEDKARDVERNGDYDARCRRNTARQVLHTGSRERRGQDAVQVDERGCRQRDGCPQPAPVDHRKERQPEDREHVALVTRVGSMKEGRTGRS